MMGTEELFYTLKTRKVEEIKVCSLSSISFLDETLNVWCTVHFQERQSKEISDIEECAEIV